jgi:hypothetical protein
MAEAKKLRKSRAIPGAKKGRPSPYKEEYKKQVYKFALLGLTEKRMAELLDVSEVTFGSWKNKKPGFLRSIREGQEFADAKVADALTERASGYEYEEAVPIKVKEVKYENGKRVREWERVEITMVKRVIPPDPQAIKYFMNNRRRNPTRKANEEPENAVWAERHEVDHTTLGEKLPAAQVYLPQDLTDAEVMGDVANTDNPQNT